jgi:diguanylate cyclase (GGDEF)-like protein
VKVLIADDDATSRLMLKAFLAKEGHSCLVAEDGSTAWSLLQAHPVEVLLTDWMMPGVDGPELCRRVRYELTDRYVYVVMVTGLGNPEQILEGMSAGADDYLVKPADKFAIQTRLVAAERVTALHRQVSHFRAQLEDANTELRRQSLTDPLTGLGNRRCMAEDLQRIAAESSATRSYVVALFDIDFFKAYNDHYGHLSGDQALQRVARCLENRLQGADRAYRYGGEEFLLVMSDRSTGEAVLTVEAVRRDLVLTAIPHDARPADPRLVTISAGVTAWDPSDEPIESVLEHADALLYQAKSAGRNQVSARPSPVGA